MQVLDGERIAGLVAMPALIEQLRRAFGTVSTIAPRQVLSIPGGTDERVFVSMPAFDSGGGGIVKLATVFPENVDKGLPTIQAAIVVFSQTGAPLALLDGTVITRLRTGAASALASRYLSRTDSARLLIIGTGALAPTMAVAHCAVRPMTHVSLWGRRAERAIACASIIRSRVPSTIEVDVACSLEEASASADIICCATSSTVPLLQGRWLKAGTFVDLVGSFSPAKREADDEVVRRSRIFVDTFAGALAEAGDLLDPLARGVLNRDRIEGELADLVCGRLTGRRSGSEITLFKSVGTALEDLAAAQYVVSLASGSSAH